MDQQTAVDNKFVDILRQSSARAFQGQPVLFAYLFGSRALGHDRPNSDIDIAIYLEPETPHDRFLPLSLELVEEMYKASGLGSIEITVLNDAPLGLVGRAIRERITIYSREEPARVEFESTKFREFMDFEFHAKTMDEKFLRDTAEGRR